MSKRSGKIKKSKFDYIDGYVLAAALILSALGILMVFSITGVSMFNNRHNDTLFFVIRSLGSTLVGLVFMIVTFLMPIQLFKKTLSIPILLITVALFILTPIIGQGTYLSEEAHRWISIGPITFQAVDLARLGFILSMAFITQHLIDKGEYYTNKPISKHLIPLGFTLLCFYTVISQPDLGSGAVILTMGTVMFMCSGITKKQIMPLVLLGIAGIGILWVFGTYVLNLQWYQLNRIMVWLDPFNHPEGFQSRMGFVAIALGGVFGVGLGQSRQALGFSIEPHTDLIITILAEELGLIAVFFVMFLYFLIAIRCFLTAFKSREVYSALICIGCGTFFLIQPLINLGGSSGFIPLSGVTLPLISYGMTSQVSIFIMLGLYFHARRYILRTHELYQRNKKTDETTQHNTPATNVVPFPPNKRHTL